MAKDAKELLDESIEVLEEKKQAQKAMNGLAKDSEESLGANKSVVKFCKDIYFTKGKAWVGGSPLTLDSQEKVKDKTSQLMIKLRDLILNLQSIGHVDWLTDYFSALEGYGIHITVDDADPEVSDTDEIEEVIKSMCAYQSIIKDNSEIIKETHGQESEDLNFAPKKDYSQVVSLYNKIQNGKDVDDEYQDKITRLEMFETALNLVYDDRPTSSDDE